MSTPFHDEPEDPAGTAKRDAPTQVWPPAVGTTIGSGHDGRYRLLDTVHSNRNSAVYRARVLELPNNAQHSAVAAAVGPGGLLALKVPVLHRTDALGLHELPISPFVVRPLLRTRGENRFELLPLAETNLAVAMHKLGPMSGPAVAALAAPMTAALIDCHTGRGTGVPIVHGDVKHSQFLLGGAVGIGLADLDTARRRELRAPDAESDPQASPSSSVPTSAVTPSFRPPGRTGSFEASRRGDAWALAVCWHIMMTGMHPAEVPEGRTLTPHEHADRVNRNEWAIHQDIDPAWRALLERIMRVDENDRPRPQDFLPDVLDLYPSEHGYHRADGLLPGSQILLTMGRDRESLTSYFVSPDHPILALTDRVAKAGANSIRLQHQRDRLMQEPGARETIEEATHMNRDQSQERSDPLTGERSPSSRLKQIAEALRIVPVQFWIVVGILVMVVVAVVVTDPSLAHHGRRH